jgi:hypothetical protein
MSAAARSIPKSAIRTRPQGIVAALVAFALVLLAGSGAQAKDEFEDAFKYELGRIAAHEAVYAGKRLLGTVLLGYPVAPVPVYVPAPAYGYGHGRYYGHRGRGHRGHHPPGLYKHTKPHKYYQHSGHHPYAAGHSSSHVYVVERESHHYYSDTCGRGEHVHVHDDH